MIRLSDADGRPVLSRESAERLGELRHVVVDVPGRRITALHVAGGDLDLDGRLVLDDRGDSQGALTDVLFEEGSGEIRAVVCGERQIPAERLRQIGPFCVVVRAEPAGGE